jgi:acyl carrier protein
MIDNEKIVAAICTLLTPFNKDGVALSEATDIPAELNIDSVGVLDFIMEVEDHFDIEIPMNVVSETRTVGELAAYVNTQLRKV